MREQTRKILVLLLTCILLAGCFVPQDVGEQLPEPSIQHVPTLPTEPPAETNTEDEAFAALDRELFLWAVTQNTATLRRNLSDPSAWGIDISRIQPKLGDWSAEANAQHMAQCRMWLSRMRELNRDALSEPLPFVYDVYEQYFMQELNFDGLFVFSEPLDLIEGVQITLKEDFVYFPIENETDIALYLALLADVPRYLEQILAHEKLRAEQGMFMTRTALNQVLADCGTEAAQKSQDTLIATFDEALRILPLNDAKIADYLARQQTLAEGYAGAFSNLRAGLSKLSKQCRASVGLREQGVKATSYYAAVLQREGSTDLSPDGAMQLLEEFRDKTYAELDSRYQSNAEEFHYESIRAFDTPQKNLDHLLKLLQDVFPEPPVHDYALLETPPAMRETAPSVFHRYATLEAATWQILTINPDAEMDILDYAHESYPGHLYHAAYQNTRTSAPLFQRSLSLPGHHEGWGMNAAREMAQRDSHFGTSYLQSTYYYDLFILLNCAIASIQVNYYGYSKAELTRYLKSMGLQAMANDIYNRAVDMPYYDFKFMLGYCAQQKIQESCKSAYADNTATYYAHYLDLGAGYFNLLQPEMHRWAKEFD